MALTGLFLDNRPRIVGLGNVIIFDAAITEQHAARAQWTQEPIESGLTVSDNRFVVPVPLVLTVIISSAELGGFDRTRHVRAWLQLEAMLTSEPAQIWTISTSLKTYRNMGISDISAPVNSETGNSLQATITALPIQIAFTAVATNLADAAQDGGQPEVDLGTQGFAP